MSIFSIILVCFAGFISHISLADSKLEILPVRIVESAQSQKKFLAYRNPCGSKPFGIYVGADDAGDKLRIGMVVERPTTRCVGMDQTEVATLSHLNVDLGMQLESFNPTIEALRYEYAEVYRSRMGDRKQQSSPEAGRSQKITTRKAQLEALYWGPTCGQFMGLVLPTDWESSQVSVVGAFEEVGFQSCEEYENKIRSVPGISIHQGNQQPAPLISQDSDALQRFTSRMTVIKPGSLKSVTSKDGKTTEVSFEYMRRCNEAPLGISIETSKRQILLSMVVVSFNSSICGNTARRKMWSTYKTRALSAKVPTNIQVRSSLNGISERIVVQEPNRVRWNKRSGQIAFEAINSCLPAIGSIIVERHNRSYVGIVRRVGQQKPHCGDLFSRVTLKQKLLANILQVSHVAPLELVR